MPKEKIIPSVSSSFNIMNELDENTYMRKNDITEHIEFYFAVTLESLTDIDKLDKIIKMYNYLEYDKKNDVIHKAILNNYVNELNKNNSFIETVCLVTRRENGDNIELENGISADKSCISLTLIIHDNENDVFGKFFRKPIYFKNKKSKYNIWSITEVEVLNDYLNMMPILNTLRLRLCLNMRAQLKKKKTGVTLNIHKYNPLPLIRMLRFIPIQYSHTNIKLLIVKKDKFYNNLVKHHLSDYILYIYIVSKLI